MEMSGVVIGKHNKQTHQFYFILNNIFSDRKIIYKSQRNHNFLQLKKNNKRNEVRGKKTVRI